MGKRRYAYVKKNGSKLEVFDKEGDKSNVWTARFDMDISDEEIENFEALKNEGKLQEINKLEATIFETELSGILTGNLGKSYTYQQPVIEVMKPRFKISIMLGLTGWLISYLVCIPLGIKKALSHGSKFDMVSSATIFMAYSIPGWAFGGVLLVLFGGGSFWDIFPLGGLHSPQVIWDNLSFIEKVIDQIHHLILPIIAWSITSFATLTVLMKNSLLDNLSQDYIRTAFAKGLSEKRVIWIHAIRNSLIPIASGIGHIIGIIIMGSYFIEMIFNINGFGKMSFQGILDRDYPIIMGFLVIVVMIRLIANLLSDLALAAVDPRIRFK
jgi:microcin C transport system permease protein